MMTANIENAKALECSKTECTRNPVQDSLLDSPKNTGGASKDG